MYSTAALILVLCCGIGYLTSILIRKSDQLFVFISRKPKRLLYNCDLSYDRYLVAYGSSRVGRKVLRCLAENGAQLHLIHSWREKEIYEELAAELRNQSRQCSVVLERLDLLLLYLGSHLQILRFSHQLSGLLYFDTEQNTLSSDDYSFILLMINFKSLLPSSPEKLSSQAVIALEFGGSSFGGKEGYDRILSSLEKLKDYWSLNNSVSSNPQVTIANTGCIWNSSEASFAYILHWLCHKLNLRTMCHQEEQSVLHALLSKRIIEANSMFFVNDSEWNELPQSKRVECKGNTIFDCKPEVVSEFEVQGSKSREENPEKNQELNESNWQEYEVQQAAPQENEKANPELVGPFAMPTMKNSKRLLSATIPTNSSTTVDTSLRENGDKDSGENKPVQLLTLMSQLEALSSSNTRMEKLLLDTKDLLAHEKNSTDNARRKKSPWRYFKSRR